MKTRIFFIFLSLSFSGCSLLYSYSDDLAQRLDQWTAEKKYNTALNTIDYIKPTHKDYHLIQKKKKNILNKMNSYESNAIKKSTQLTKQGSWIKAFELLDEVKENIVDTQKIEKHRSKLLIKRNKVITNYENDILYSQAIDLAGKMKLYNKIKKTVSKDEDNQLDISEFDKLRQETSLRLMQRSEQQYKKGQYDSALTTIDIALKLKPNEDIVSGLNDIKKRVTKETQHKKTVYIKEIKNLLNKLSQGYSHAILKETKEKIKWLNTIKGDEKVYLKLISKLEKHLAAGTKQRFEAARKLYSEGKTQEALSIWIQLKELDPDNVKLQSHIERAEKVLLKLKELSNKPKAKNKK